MPAFITSLLKMKCPVCRKGNVFIHKNPYDYKHVGDIYDACTDCGQNFRPEPGFYFGAAIVSNPLTVAFNLFVAWMFYAFVGDLFNHVTELLTTLTLASLLFLPISFRYSRIIWLFIVFKYKPKSA